MPQRAENSCLGPHAAALFPRGAAVSCGRALCSPEVQAAYMAQAERKGWGSTWEEVEAHVARDIPIRRIVTREEVAALVVFLSSPLADGIHGQNIRVDGGGLDILT